MFDKFSPSQCHAVCSRNNTPRRIHPYKLTRPDRTEPYTRIEPFQERRDTSIELARNQLSHLHLGCAYLHDDFLRRFFYKPVTLTGALRLAVALAALGYAATTQDVLEEGRDKRRVSALCLNSGRIIVNECVGAHASSRNSLK